MDDFFQKLRLILEKKQKGYNIENKDYMHKTFPNLELRPPLFYSWDVGIRFELGVEGEGEFGFLLYTFPSPRA
ncbi:hypothetical protein U8V97_18885, partial [Priestia filamentosa]